MTQTLTQPGLISYPCESAFKYHPAAPTMKLHSIPSRSTAERNLRPFRLRRQPVLRLAAVAAAALFCTAGQALDFGPDGMFFLNGFGKFDVTRSNNNCSDCQWALGEAKDRYWADAVVPGKLYQTRETHVSLLQPYLGFKYDLGQGFKLGGLWSQRWRDGQPDIPGFFYEKNLSLRHEDYGSLQIGAMTTRAWSMADYPYGGNIGLSDQWGSAGAGYGLLTQAVRYTSRIFDFAEGDLVLEATYDRGNVAFTKNVPKFLEIWVHYGRGDFTMDAMYQDSRNGNPQAWSHGPFKSVVPFAADDQKVGGSGQSIAMVMAKYQLTTQIELSGGVRRNRWSGAYAVPIHPGVVITPWGNKDEWNGMFNVDWNDPLYKGYPASSTDWMLGARYKMDQWTASTGMVHLGTASTSNPMERGQSNSALYNTVGLTYDFRNGFQLGATAGIVQFGRLGLSPMSMPGNAAFGNFDSRVTTRGNWFTISSVYSF